MIIHKSEAIPAVDSFGNITGATIHFNNLGPGNSNVGSYFQIGLEDYNLIINGAKTVDDFAKEFITKVFALEPEEDLDARIINMESQSELNSQMLDEHTMMMAELAVAMSNLGGVKNE